MIEKLRLKYRSFKMDRYERRVEKMIEREFKKSSFKWCKQKLTSKQEEQVQDFYLAHAGRKINTMYHAYFLSRNGYFSPKYIPEGIYLARISYRLNDMRMRNAYADKNQFERLFPQIRHPESILKCINGYFYSKEQPITREQAAKLCGNISEAIIKPTLESEGGNRVCLFSSGNGILEDGRSIADLFDSYGKNFIIQKRIKQHPVLSALNPSSINTIRILTYRRQNEIEILYTVIRIGRKDKVVDNESAGGMSARIERDGTLAKYAFGTPEEGAREKTDAGVVIEGYSIPSFEKIKETVKQLHFQLPFFNLVGWDMAMDEEGEPVFIECNFHAGLSQSAHGPAFGEFTEEILNVIRAKPTTRFVKMLGASFKNEQY